MSGDAQQDLEMKFCSDRSPFDVELYEIHAISILYVSMVLP